jgi:hypothetical protein
MQWFPTWGTRTPRGTRKKIEWRRKKAHTSTYKFEITAAILITNILEILRVQFMERGCQGVRKWKEKRLGTTAVVNERNCICFLCAPVPTAPEPLRYWGFTIILRHTTLGRTPLDKWSAGRREPYLTTHNTHKRHTFVLLAGFDPAIPVSEQPQTHALDRATTGSGEINCRPIVKWNYVLNISSTYRHKIVWNCTHLPCGPGQLWILMCRSLKCMRFDAKWKFTQRHL